MGNHTATEPEGRGPRVRVEHTLRSTVERRRRVGSCRGCGQGDFSGLFDGGGLRGVAGRTCRRRQVLVEDGGRRERRRYHLLVGLARRRTVKLEAALISQWRLEERQVSYMKYDTDILTRYRPYAGVRYDISAWLCLWTASRRRHCMLTVQRQPPRWDPEAHDNGYRDDIRVIRRAIGD